MYRWTLLPCLLAGLGLWWSAHSTTAWTVQPIAGKGYGVIAARTIAAGELLLHEADLFTVPVGLATQEEADGKLAEALSRLDDGDRAAFRNLSNAEHGDWRVYQVCMTHLSAKAHHGRPTRWRPDRKPADSSRPSRASTMEWVLRAGQAGADWPSASELRMPDTTSTQGYRGFTPCAGSRKVRFRWRRRGASEGGQGRRSSSRTLTPRYPEWRGSESCPGH
jgi:hypothetical protein